MNLKQTTITGLFWSSISQVGKQGIQFIITIVLARLLTPTDFGLVGMAMVFTGFASILVELGIGNALIQKQDTNEAHWSSAFWFNIGLGFLLTIIFIILAPYISDFYGRPELQKVLLVISLNFILASFMIVQQSHLFKKMDFKKLMLMDTTAVVLSGLLGVILAFNAFGVWSLVFQLLSFTLISNLLLWKFSGWRPKFIFSKDAIRDIFKFSSNLAGAQIINYFSRNIDRLLIGKILGAEALGFYSLAYKFMMLPLQNISWIIARVTFPAFSKIQFDLLKVQKNYLKMVRTISLFTFPLMAFLFSFSPEILAILFGPQWMVVSDIVRILCFCGLIQSIGTTAGIIFQSLGRTDIELLMGILNISIVTFVVLLGLKDGIIGVALFYSAASIIWVHISFLVVIKLLKLRYLYFYRNFFKAYLISFLLIILLFTLKKLVHIYDFNGLVLVTLIGILTYLFLLFSFGLLKHKNGKLNLEMLT